MVRVFNKKDLRVGDVVFYRDKNKYGIVKMIPDDETLALGYAVLITVYFFKEKRVENVPLDVISVVEKGVESIISQVYKDVSSPLVSPDNLRGSSKDPTKKSESDIYKNISRENYLRPAKVEQKDPSPLLKQATQKTKKKADDASKETKKMQDGEGKLKSMQ